MLIFLETYNNYGSYIINKLNFYKYNIYWEISLIQDLD